MEVKEIPRLAAYNYNFPHFCNQLMEARKRFLISDYEGTMRVVYSTKPGEEKKKEIKKEEIKIHKSKEECSFGCCAAVAICSAFDIPGKSLNIICDVLGISEINKGLNFWECKKIINRIAKSCKCNVIYHPNKAKVTFKQMIMLLSSGAYVIMFGNHLSYMENGELYDSFLYKEYEGDTQAEKYLAKKPTGWWKIK